jgi:hypothetical protein
MTLIGSAIKAVENIFDQATAKAMLAPHQAGAFLQNHTFGHNPLAKGLKETGKKIGDTNFNEKAYGAFGEIGDKLHIPDITHKVADSIKNNITPTGQVVDHFVSSAVNSIDQWSPQLGHMASFVAQVGQTIL